MLLIATSAAAWLAALAEDEGADKENGASWKKNDGAADPEDAKQVLADSPWVKTVQLQIVRDLSPDERRAGGNMEADIGKGVGLAGIAGLFGSARAEDTIARARLKRDPQDVHS